MRLGSSTRRSISIERLLTEGHGQTDIGPRPSVVRGNLTVLLYFRLFTFSDLY